ncbi:hypothetical protein DIZ76_014209 [Coccidioides immitis]|nr:hypothetical protein DIZ76_014209 [Coccidioides immitis]
MAIYNWFGRWRCWVFILSPIPFIILLHQLLTYHDLLQHPFIKNAPKITESGCDAVPGMEDILVVMKTGVTEALEKVPIHLETTLSCVPHFAIFSDFEEDISGVQTYDVLRTVSKDVKRFNPDFELYNRIKKLGRDGLRPSDLMMDDVSGPSGKPNNPGWKLDKWKFIPMINEALEVRPDAKWFVFMEADTYIVWQNLLAWLERFDPSKPYYLGTEMLLGNILFGYGGSGFVISNSAMEKFSQYRASRATQLEDYTAHQWAGDGILGKAMADAGIPLTKSWPMLQTARVWDLNHFAEPWCYPVVSYHHMTPSDVEIMWRFSQQWFKNNTSSILLHQDVFTRLIQPGLSSPRDNWDNFSEEEHNVPSEDQCKALCVDNSACLQYSHRSGKCFTSKTAKRGASTSSCKSGWIPDRIRQHAEKMGSCEKLEWIR